MDTLELELKISANTAAIQDVQSQLDKLKTSTKETSDGFGIADTSLGKLWNTLTTGVEKGVNSFKTLSGALAATGIGLLLISVAELYNWFNKTEEGSNVLKKIMAELGVVLRDGPLFVINALKIPLDVIVGYFKVLYTTITSMIGVITGKIGLSEAIKNVSASFKEQADKVTADAQALVDLAAVEKQRVIDTAHLADLEAAQRKQERDDKEALAILNEDAIKSREKAAQAGVTLAQKEKLLNEAKEDQNKIYKINHEAALKSIEIAELAIKAGDQSGAALDKLAAANAHLTDVETARDAAMMRIDRRSTSTSNAITKQKEAEAKELATLNEGILEDSLEGQKKEQAALDFKYKEDQEKFKNNADILKALQEKYWADSRALDEKHVAEAEKLKAEADKVAQEKLDKANKKKIDDHEAILKELDKFDTKDQTTAMARLTKQYKAERDAFEKLCKDKKATAEELAKGITAIDLAEDNAKKKLRTAQTENVLDQAAQELDAISSLAGKSTILGKATAIGGIIANSAKGVMAAWATAEELGPILGPILAAVQTGIIVATGIKSIGQVTAVQAPAAQHLAAGGWVGGGSPYGDHVPLMGNSGEYMMNGQAMSNPQIAQMVMSMNANPHGNAGGGQLTEERVIELATQTVKAIPVTVSEHFITLAQDQVKVRQNIFSVA